MQFEFLFLGRTKENFLAEGIDHFLNRIKRYAGVEVRTIKEKSWSSRESEAKIREEEGQLLLSRVRRPSLLVVLDRRGKQVCSEELAGMLAKWEEGGQRCVTFLLGGPLGLPPSLLKTADESLALSRMTLTHEMARLVLAEQLYRALTIRAGTGYHK